MKKEVIKCLIWDLDNTLWNGILSETDTPALKPGIINIIHELDNRGVLQSIASKNNFDDAVRKLSDAGIAEYFLYPQISWQPKSVSIKNIRQLLNIDISSCAFIDDDAFERAEVESVHPTVLLLKAEAYQTVLSDPRFQPEFVTEDSRRRRQMYIHDEGRKKMEENFQGPAEAFLKSLSMHLMVNSASETDLQRAAELTIRTNQLNTTGITYDYEELNNFRISPSYHLFISELTDRFGSYGKIGLILLQENEEAIVIRLFLMSCRVMSRGIGNVLLLFLMKFAKSRSKKLYADFQDTGRNRLMYITYKLAGFTESERDGEKLMFYHSLENLREYPDFINMDAGYID